MSQYTTGELAKLCGVSVRTVQFYDGKDLLKPAGLTEGGRRLYSEEELKKLQRICLLKTIGLSLHAIKDVVADDASEKVLLALLDEQARQLKDDLEAKQGQLETIRALQGNLRSSAALPVNSISDIETIMKNKKYLRRTYLKMVLYVLLMAAIAAGAAVYGVLTDHTWHAAVAIPAVLLALVLMIRTYYKNVAYVCAECNAKFKPPFFRFLFANHTPRTRKLECPVCKHHGYCVEVAAKD